MKAQLSVVIPCYNAAATIGELLESLAEQKWSEPWEVIVADNGCTDASMSIVERYRDRLPALRIVDASARRGQPYALNVGGRAASGDALVFVDADDVVAPGWLAAIGRALGEHDFVASRHDAEKLNPEWLVASRGQAQRDGLERIWYPPYLPFVGGCGLGVKRAHLEKVGGLAEDFPYLNDVDLSFRLQRAGVKPVFAPEAVVYVRFRDDLAGVFRQARRWAQYNVLVYKRHRPRVMRISHPWREYWRRWRMILRRLRRARARIARYQLAWQIGWHIGLLIGSIRYRVAPAVHVRERRPTLVTQDGPAPDSSGLEAAEERTRLAG